MPQILVVQAQSDHTVSVQRLLRLTRVLGQYHLSSKAGVQTLYCSSRSLGDM